MDKLGEYENQLPERPKDWHVSFTTEEEVFEQLRRVFRAVREQIQAKEEKP